MAATVKFLTAYELNQWFENNPSYEVDETPRALPENNDEGARRERRAYWEPRLDTMGKKKFLEDGRLPSVEPQTEQWMAWRDFLDFNGFGVKFMDRMAEKGVPWTVVSEYPPQRREI